MSRTRHAQVHVVVLVPRKIGTPIILVGTPSQRGFTELGAKKAQMELQRKMGQQYDVGMLEVTPIDELV